MSLNTIDGIEECWFFRDEVFDFTEEDKKEAITTLQILARGLATKDDPANIAGSLMSLANQLRSLDAANAKEYLVLYLNADQLTSMANIKSFIYLKKIVEDSLEGTLVLEKKLADNVVLSLLHLVFYKSIPCPRGNHCKHYPRKIVHKNDFLDVELDCYYYHHEKDRRRFVLGDGQKEFKYAGNFGDGKKTNDEKADFSHNFFESLFHPLYYKNFKCVRTKCEKSVYCPYYHSNEEKTIWGIIFRNFIGKDREVFTKKKDNEDKSQQKLYVKRPSQFAKRAAANGNYKAKQGARIGY